MDSTWFVVVRDGAPLPEGTVLRVVPSAEAPIERVVPSRLEPADLAIEELESLIRSGAILAVTEAEVRLLMGSPPRPESPGA